MPSNKNKPNAFKYFMIDWKNQEEKKGRQFVNGLKDVQKDPALKMAWDNLPANEKLSYKEKEKNEKLKQNVNKKTNLGEPVEEVLQRQMREKASIDNMRKHISCVVKEAKAERSLLNEKFYVIHVNYFCVYDCDIQFKYCPAEIGLVEFSLEKGVTRSYNKLINSKIRMGYAHEARVHSNNTHQIPQEKDFGEKNYDLIFKEICEFVKPDKVNGAVLPLFTLFSVEKVKNPVLSVLDFLASFSKEDTKNFVIYSFEELFVNLYNINLKENCLDQKIDETIASMYLKKDLFDYKSSLCCEFHKLGPGGNFCSTSIVKRWTFILFSKVCCLFKIKTIPGYHEPIENSCVDLDLKQTFGALNLHEGPDTVGDLSIEWNKGNSFKPASERTFRDEENRRAQSKPLEITFHGSFQDDAANFSVLSEEQPVISSTDRLQRDHSAEISLNENNFPSIGRGAAIRRYKTNKTPKIGYASCLK